MRSVLTEKRPRVDEKRRVLTGVVHNTRDAAPTRENAAVCASVICCRFVSHAHDSYNSACAVAHFSVGRLPAAVLVGDSGGHTPDLRPPLLALPSPW